jgi:signal transduction histidine kinase
MSPEVLARLFQPFFTTKGPNAGTGLGLASVRQLMKELGGSLGVESTPGRGSAFTLHIPLTD